MTKEAVTKVVQRAISDGAFRRQLSTDPTKALRGFDLSPAETAAIRSGDSGRLTAFGVDLRMSGDTSDTDPMISSGNEVGRAGVVIPGDPAHALGADTGSDGGTALPDDADQYTPQFHSTTQDAITSDDGASGASTPGEAGDGPEIQP